MSQYPNEKDWQSAYAAPTSVPATTQDPRSEGVNPSAYAYASGAPTSVPAAQYPNEKDPRSDWVNPPASGAATAQSPNPQVDWVHRYQAAYAPAPGASPQPQPQHYAPPPPPPQGYYPPPGPPPDYGYVQNHPEGGPASDVKVPLEAAHTPSRGHSPYSTPPDGGPSSSSGQEGNQGGMSLGSFFGNKGSPPMWNRLAPQHLPYNAFPPMCLISNSKSLSSGFPELPPPCQLQPHPFATHDVTEEDWRRFLADIKKGASLSASQRIKSNVIPLVTGLSFVSGLFVTHAIEKRMKSKNRTAAGDLVDHWNHYFFGPRRMEVVLCQGSDRLSGRFGAAPVGDANQMRMAEGLRRDRSDGSSSDSCSSEHGSRRDKEGRRAARRERREARRARKAEKRARKGRGEDERPYELYITAI